MRKFLGRSTIVLGLALGATFPARAQVQLNPVPNYAAITANAYAQGQAIAAQRVQMDAIQAQQAAAARGEAAEDLRRDRTRRVGKLIDGGQCGQARALAFDEGDFDMAMAIPQECHASSAAPPQP
jgi:hypothetical protein